MGYIGCNHPMVRLETYHKYKKVDGTMGYKAEFCSPDIYDGDFGKWINGKYRRINLIPCGKCLGCRLEYSRDKAVQLSLEGMNPKYKPNQKWFLTLTYDDEHLRTYTTTNIETGEKFEGISTQQEDLQLFWKRWRKNHPEDEIKYLNVTEYGGKTYRPHCHAIVFGMTLDESTFTRHSNNPTTGDPYFSCKELTEAWGLGEVIIGEVTFQSIAYVARYTVKKTKAQYDDWWYMSQGKRKEWISMSEGMGRWYYDLHRDEIYKYDLVPVKDKNGQPSRPPRAYDRLYKKECPEEWEKVRRKREQKAIAAEIARRNQSNLETWEYRKVSDLILSQNMKDLRGDCNGL